VNTKIQTALAAVALCAMMPAAAFAAGTAQGTVTVSANVAQDCILSVPSTTLALGTVDPLTATTPDATPSSVSVKCNAGSIYTIGLGATAGATPAFATQTFAMNNGAHTLNYTAGLQSYGATAPSPTAAVTDALTLAIVSSQDAYVGNYAGSFFVTVAF
jgi:hypothetical protein